MSEYINTFCMLLSENCNFACKYCYEKVGNGHNSKSMSLDVARDALAYMFESDITSDEVSISLFGGEPTLNPDVIEYVFDRGRELSKIHGKKFSAGIITNGSLMNERLYDILTKNSDILNNLQLSIDGAKDTQDMNRVLCNGGGSFDMVAKNIPHWKAISPILNIHGVINADTVQDLFANYKFFREEWDVERLWFMPAKDVRYTQDHVDAYDEQMGKIREYIMKNLHLTKDLQTLRAVAPFDKALMQGGMGKPCGMGDSYVVVTADGGIWPCHHMYFVDSNDETKMGDIYNGIDDSKRRVWQEYDENDMIGCENCDHDKCYRCPAENYEQNGSAFVQITGMHCKFMKVDQKHQRLIIEELEEMGALPKAPVPEISIPSYNDISNGVVPAPQNIRSEPIPTESTPTDTNTILKSILNDVIEVLVKHHNQL